MAQAALLVRLERSGPAGPPEKELCFYALLPPRGPDYHANRADLDHFFVKLFPKYGVTYQDKTAVTGFESDASGARLTLKPEGEAAERTVTASYVVDCTGHASFLAKKFGLRKEGPELSTNSRSIFGHFQNTRFLDDILPPNEEVGFLRDGGTIHHVFHGGWIWGIRFDSGVMSVGITLDRDVWPLDESIPAEVEMRTIIDRYPTVKAALGEMVPIRPIIRTGRVHGGTDRIQFAVSSIVGERFILSPHSSGFIDPLFSTGILLTGAFLNRFVPLAAKAVRTATGARSGSARSRRSSCARSRWSTRWSAPRCSGRGTDAWTWIIPSRGILQQRLRPNLAVGRHYAQIGPARARDRETLHRAASPAASGTSAASAFCFTGDALTCCPRPRSLSGCVTTPTARLAEEESSASSEGTANSGVPKRTTRMKALEGVPENGAREWRLRMANSA